ncbi:hypothetical protein Y1Q_0016640 [Alligator mississippiensis]|uniref:Uncharacterized protein n=1 Tax=Alligator mississippiensis TaxID=8496 RepID=A0A151P6Y7_ALLMI|nr:hypothetical protein Y1Q_0016640 [Alligator mississippiensis]
MGSPTCQVTQHQGLDLVCGQEGLQSEWEALQRSLSSPEKWLLMSTRKKAGKCPMDPWCQQMGSTQSGLRALPQVWHREQNQGQVRRGQCLFTPGPMRT